MILILNELKNQVQIPNFEADGLNFENDKYKYNKEKLIRKRKVCKELKLTEYFFYSSSFCSWVANFGNQDWEHSTNLCVPTKSEFEGGDVNWI